MSNEKRTGLGSVPAGLLRPTTRLDNKEKDREKDRSEIVEDETIESIHFRLRQLAYERGLKLSEAAAEVLDRSLPFYEIVKKDRAG